MKKKTLITIIICVVAVLAIIGATVGVSLAIWQENKHESLYVEFTIQNDNPSLKYQMFVPVESSGNETTTETSAYKRIEGSFSVEQEKYSYTLKNADDVSKIEGFALVGWYGGISFDGLDIPNTVIVKINGNNVEKPVVRVMADKEFSAYSFGGDNTVIKKITVGYNVKEVDAGFFYGMSSLETLILNDTDQINDNYIYLRPYCFGGCVNLSTIQNYRNYVDGWDNSAAFYDSYVLE